MEDHGSISMTSFGSEALRRAVESHIEARLVAMQREVRLEVGKASQGHRRGIAGRAWHPRGGATCRKWTPTDTGCSAVYSSVLFQFLQDPVSKNQEDSTGSRFNV